MEELDKGVDEREQTSSNGVFVGVITLCDIVKFPVSPKNKAFLIIFSANNVCVLSKSRSFSAIPLPKMSYRSS